MLAITQQPASSDCDHYPGSWIRCCTVTLTVTHCQYCHTGVTNQHGSCELSNSLLVTMSNVHAPPNTRYMHSAKPSSAPPRDHIKRVFHGATESVPSALREEDKLSKCGLSGIDFFNFHWVLLRQTFARTNAIILSSKSQLILLPIHTKWLHQYLLSRVDV